MSFFYVFATPSPGCIRERNLYGIKIIRISLRVYPININRWIILLAPQARKKWKRRQFTYCHWIFVWVEPWGCYRLARDHASLLWLFVLPIALPLRRTMRNSLDWRAAGAIFLNQSADFDFCLIENCVSSASFTQFGNIIDWGIPFPRRRRDFF